MAETAVEKRARLAQEKADAKAATKQQALVMKTAEFVASKVGPLSTSLRAVTGKANFAMLSPIVITPIQEAIARFSDWQHEADLVLSGASDVISTDVKGVAADVAQVRKNLAMATTMLGQLGRIAK